MRPEAPPFAEHLGLVLFGNPITATTPTRKSSVWPRPGWRDAP